MRTAGSFIASVILAAATAIAGPPVNLTVLGQVPLSGFMDGLFVHDNLAFLMQSTGGVRTVNIYDVSDPANPALVGAKVSLPDSFADMHGIYYTNGLLFCGIQGGGGGGLVTLDVSDPAKPKQLSYLPVAGRVHDMRYAAGYLYLMMTDSGSDDFRVYDVSNPSLPVEVNKFNLSGSSYCHDVSFMDGIGYASMWDAGVYTLDVSDPLNIKIINHSDPIANLHSAWPTPDKKYVVSCQEQTNNTGGDKAGVRIWDVTAAMPATYQQVGKYNQGMGSIVHDVMVVGNFAYVTYYGNGFYVLDISDPANPVEVASIITGTGCGGAYCDAISQWVEDGLVYLLDSSRGLFIIDFGRPHPTPITLYAVKSNGGQDVAVTWNHTGESQYTMRRSLRKDTVGDNLTHDVDAETRWSDTGAVPDLNKLYFYKINGAWK